MYSYIASPYTHRDPEVMRERFYAAMKFTGWKLRRGESVYSPIVHCHEMAAVENLPTDFAFWEQYNMHMLIPSKELIVLTLPGWDESVGVRGELRFAKLLGKPISYATTSDLLDYVIYPVGS